MLGSHSRIQKNVFNLSIWNYELCFDSSFCHSQQSINLQSWWSFRCLLITGFQPSASSSNLQTAARSSIKQTYAKNDIISWHEKLTWTTCIWKECAHQRETISPFIYLGITLGTFLCTPSIRLSCILAIVLKSSK